MTKQYIAINPKSDDLIYPDSLWLLVIKLIEIQASLAAMPKTRNSEYNNETKYLRAPRTADRMDAFDNLFEAEIELMHALADRYLMGDVVVSNNTINVIRKPDTKILISKLLYIYDSTNIRRSSSFDDLLEKTCALLVRDYSQRYSIPFTPDTHYHKIITGFYAQDNNDDEAPEL